MPSNSFYSINRLLKPFKNNFARFVLSFLCAQIGYAAPVDTQAYDPDCGVGVKVAGKTLVIGWGTAEGSTELTLNLSGQGALVRSVAVASGKEKHN